MSRIFLIYTYIVIPAMSLTEKPVYVYRRDEQVCLSKKIICINFKKKQDTTCIYQWEK